MCLDVYWVGGLPHRETILNNFRTQELECGFLVGQTEEQKNLKNA